MKWTIQIPDFMGGFAPCYWDDDYPTIGNANQAGKMSNIDLTNPKYMTQGPGLSTLTNGDENGSVTTLIKGMIDYAVANDTTYGIGGAKVYKISSSTVTNSGGFPHTITGTNPDGEDVAYYHGDFFYSWNDDSGGDVGMYDISEVSWDDDWGSTVPTGATALQAGVPHPLLAAGNDFLYIGNGYYVTSYDGTTFTEQDLDLPQDATIQDMAWHLNRLFIAANRPDVSGSNKNIASIYIWDGNASSWEDEITVRGEIGALHVANNRLYAFWRDISGKSRIGLVNAGDGTIDDLELWDGSLPEYYQVTDYKGHIIWVSDGLIYAYGAPHFNLEPKIFQLADAGHATGGGIVCPFSVPLVASYTGSNYKIAKFSGYDTSSYWRSLLFDVSATEENAEGKSIIDKIIFNIGKLASGARADIKFYDESGVQIGDTITISHTNNGAVHQVIENINSGQIDCFRINIDFSNGSTSNPVKFKSIVIKGHTVESKR